MSVAADRHVRTSIDLLSAWIGAQMAYSGVPGLSIGIVHDQELVWAAGFGHAGLEPRAPGHRPTPSIASPRSPSSSPAPRSCSCATPASCGWTIPLVEHLPWFRIGGAHAEAPAVTIRHLLTHTAGLPREAGVPVLDRRRVPDARRRSASGWPTQQAALPTETEWKYSNLGLTLAGEIVAGRLRPPYAEYVAEHILEPLGMRRTWVTTPPADHPDLATGYARRLPAGPRSGGAFTDGRGITAAANMTTSVDRPRAVRDAAVPRRAGRRRPDPARQHAARDAARALAGARLGGRLGARLPRHAHPGQDLRRPRRALRGYRTIVHLCPADRIGVIVLTNADDGNPLLFAEKAFQWVAPAILKVVAPAATAGPPTGWERYAGQLSQPVGVMPRCSSSTAAWRSSTPRSPIPCSR